MLKIKQWYTSEIPSEVPCYNGDSDLERLGEAREKPAEVRTKENCTLQLKNKKITEVLRQEEGSVVSPWSIAG